MANFTYRKYIEHIVKNDLYDFCRMLEDAAKIIDSTSGECTVCLCTEKNLQVKIKDVEWILADEFQDCSPALNALLQAIQNVNERARFVCVGDDWQAINGFSGSDTKYINNFSSYFQGASESTLLTNLRSPQNIVDCSNNLMRGHGMPARSETQGGDVRVVTLNSITGSDRYELIPEMYITAIRQIIDRYPSGTEFAVLTRANKFFSLFQEEFARKIRKGFVGKKIDVSTVHKYKGREVDVVIIANVTEKNFPLLHPDRYRHEILGVTDEKILLEERRLFYVALTRAVKAVYLITEENRESPFIADLRYSEVNPEDGIIEEIPF